MLDEGAVEHRCLHRLFRHQARGDVAAPHEHVLRCRHLVEDEGDVAVGALGAADPGVHLGGRIPPVAHRAEALDDDDKVGRMHEVEERHALERVGLVAGDPAEVVAPGEADPAVGVEDGDGEGMDDRRGSSRVTRLRHVVLPLSVSPPCMLPATGIPHGVYAVAPAVSILRRSPKCNRIPG